MQYRPGLPDGFLAKTRLLQAERRRRGTPKGSTALTCFWEAVLALRWFRERTSPDALARDHGVSRATAYRYLEEVIEVLASQAPGLRQALERAKDEGLFHVILDGAIIPSDRCKEPAISVKGEVIDLWYSGKAHTHGGSIQAVTAPGRVPAVGLRCGARLGAGPHRRPHPATRSSGPYAAWANAGSPSSPAGGAPCSTSPPAPANRRHRPRRARPDPFRARLHHMNSAEITSVTCYRGLPGWKSLTFTAHGRRDTSANPAPSRMTSTFLSSAPGTKMTFTTLHAKLRSVWVER